MRSFSRASRLILAPMTAAASCLACSIVYRTIPLGPSFRVRVQDHGRPVQGLAIKLEGRGRKRVAVTDNNGYANFRALATGDWFVKAERDLGVSAETVLKVTRDGPSDVTVPLEWSNAPRILARKLKGTIHGPDYLRGQPQAEFTIDILQRPSGKSRRTLRTNDRGEFDFETAPPGLYYLRLNPNYLISVVVDPNAPAEHFAIDIGSTSCGLYYADANQCSQGELQVDRLAGKVVDATGAAIPNAKITLIDSSAKVMEQLQSENFGGFASLRTPPEGIYELVVSAVGFTPYRRPLRIDPNSALPRPAQLTVRMGVMGACSVANLQ